jgi:hypothetical protein
MSVLTDSYISLAPSEIEVPEHRQRTALDLDDAFLDSIRARGMYTPILITQDHVLIAGGRRYAAALSLKLASVPCRYVEEGLDETLIAIIELEENIRRKELPWQDEAKAIQVIHALRLSRDSTWTQERTSKELSLGSTLYIWLRVARALSDEQECEKIKDAKGMRAAYNICMRIDERLHDSVMEELSEFTDEAFSNSDTAHNSDSVASETAREGDSQAAGEVRAEGGGDGVSPPLSSSRTSPPLRSRTGISREAKGERESILNLDFIPWARTYSGMRFNFVHCDFPYGKQVFSAEQGGASAEEEFKYEDSPITYWELCKVLCEERDRLMTPSAHLVFWTSSDIANMHETIEFFRKNAPDLIFQPRALIWHKSDNTGIVHDARRGPRWTYETALMATRGDRVLVKPLAASYSAPTARALHPSTKPEPVLRHFFSMFVDATTLMLDPTCGSGSALRAAESLGAANVLGIEKSVDFAQSARKALREFRILREFSHKG